MQTAADRVVRVLLATPGVHRVVSGWLITVYLVGRTSGRRYTLPVAYPRVDSTLLIGTPFDWRRNLWDNPRFAKFDQIGLDPGGNPAEAVLHAVWRAGAHSFQLSPR